MFELLVFRQWQHLIKSPYFLLRHFLASWKSQELLLNKLADWQLNADHTSEIVREVLKKKKKLYLNIIYP